MNILTLCGVCCVCVAAVLILKENGNKGYAAILGSVCIVIIFSLLLDKIKIILNFVRVIASADNGIIYVDAVIKSFGVAFVAEVGADTLRELGSENIAKILESAARVEMLILCIEPLGTLLDKALSFIGHA